MTKETAVCKWCKGSGWVPVHGDNSFIPRRVRCKCQEPSPAVPHDDISPEELNGIARGLADVAAGRVKPLSQIKDELAAVPAQPIPPHSLLFECPNDGLKMDFHTQKQVDAIVTHLRFDFELLNVRLARAEATVAELIEIIKIWEEYKGGPICNYNYQEITKRAEAAIARATGKEPTVSEPEYCERYYEGVGRYCEMQKGHIGPHYFMRKGPKPETHHPSQPTDKEKVCPCMVSETGYIYWAHTPDCPNGPAKRPPASGEPQPNSPLEALIMVRDGMAAHKNGWKWLDDYIEKHEFGAVASAEGKLPPLEPFPNLHNPDVCECDLVGLEHECEIHPTLAELTEKYGTLQQRERQLLAAREELALRTKDVADLNEELTRHATDRVNQRYELTQLRQSHTALLAFMAWLKKQAGVLVRDDGTGLWRCGICGFKCDARPFANQIEHKPNCLFRKAIEALEGK